MTKISRNFTLGRMNKSLDERLIPNGEYIEALNVRVNSSEGSDVGVVENAIGNEKITSLKYKDTVLSFFATTIGAIADDSNSTVYWFVHDPEFNVGATGKLDMIVSYNASNNSVRYHVVSIDDGGGENTTLNFSPNHFLTGVNLIDDMLFFTDDYNQPRKINITQSYASPSDEHVDQFLEDEILVIKKPPVSAPSITTEIKEGERNYMSDKFLSFAYRYKYKDGEYSAISQFTEPAFIPKDFVNINSDSFLNDGMMNEINTVTIGYNTGSKNVIGIDILFKEHGTNNIKIIDRIDKKKSSIDNNIDRYYEFNNSKVYTILGQDELLRLYDNVPLLAKAQTIMGNRLMYGNYLEGYDLVDHEDRDVLIEYDLSLIDRKANVTAINDLSLLDGSYQIYPTLKTVNDSVLSINLNDLVLKKGSILKINLNLTFDSWEDFGIVNSPEDFSISLEFELQRNYYSVAELIDSQEFKNKVGTSSNIKPLVSGSEFVTTSCDGYTWTDIFNCAVPNMVIGSANNWYKQYSRQYGLGINNHPIKVLNSPVVPNSIILQIPAIRYSEDPSLISSAYVHAFFSISNAEVYISSTETNASLHSNNGYEVGIIYMDDYNRATPVLSSNTNTIYIPSERSKYSNAIRVTIPHTQIAPYWAKRYKFAIKADSDTYETIYSSRFYEVDDEFGNKYAYLLLEGENARKIEADDELIVKRDALLHLNDYKSVKVISKESKEAHTSMGRDYPEGVYIKISASDLTFDMPGDNIIQEQSSTSVGRFDQYAVTNLPFSKIPSDNFDPNIPKGAVIYIKIDANASTPGNVVAGDYREYEREFSSEIEVTASKDYEKFSEFWNGENVSAIINSNNKQSTYTGDRVLFSFNSEVASSEPELNEAPYKINAQIWDDDGIEKMKLSGFPALGEVLGEDNSSSMSASYKITRNGDGIAIFETIPSESQADIFFEGSQVFEIGENGNHKGNYQDQDIDTEQAAIVELDFANCYSFGNGAESYKIRDSLSGKPMTMGQRVVTSTNEEYRQIRRYVDISYSGIYNDNTNVNKLNEFNQGLVNYKKLEDSFGSIQLIDGRKTDVLVLQEEKISYVLAGKNLLSDAAAGSVISSVPEVLGTQVARLEEYGISTHPESFSKHGGSKFFTDANNGAVLMLTGDSFQNEQLTVISDLGMRPFFRDLFNISIKAPKIGGYDPYLNEYVLSTLDADPYDYIEYMNCGTSKSFKITEGNPLTIYISYDKSVGNATINYDLLDVNYPLVFDLEYYNQNITSGDVTTSGVISFNKTSLMERSAKLIITSTQGDAFVNISPTCVKPSILTVTEIVLSDRKSENQSVKNMYRFKDGDYTSPLRIIPTTLNDGVSFWNTFTANQGDGAIPTDFSELRIISKSYDGDNFVFDTSHDNFKFLRTNTEYTQEDLDTILSNADFSFLDPIEQNGAYYSNFFVPELGDYMYIIWDYRELKGFDYSWSNFVCVEEKSYGYFFDWSNFVCVQEKNSGFEADWSNFICVQEETLEGFDYFWGGFVCVQEFQSDFDATWSNFICVQEETSGFAADWSNFICVQEETSGFAADWSNFICVQEQVTLFSANWSNFICVQEQESDVNVGDQYEGGTIYYILQPTDPGYESSKTKGFIYVDPIVSREFGCEGTETKTIQTIQLGQGSDNTNIINEFCVTSRNTAASYCSGYNDGTYSDWFLPSSNELEKLMESGLPIPSNVYIWASNDSMPDASKYAVSHIKTSKGDSSIGNLKSNIYRVIPVRAFEIIN